jgi:superkiller protein 3
VELFPENALSEVVRGYFWFHNIRLEEDEERDKEEGKEEVDTSETGLDTLLVSARFSNCSDSRLS